MTYAGYKPNETASLGAITATGIDAITKINLEREKQDAARQIKKDALAAKAAQDKEKQAAKEAADLEKEKNSTKEKLSKNEGKTPFTINLQANMGEVGVKNIDLDPSSQNALILQSSTWHAFLGNQDATTAKLAANKNPSQQAIWRYERTVGDFQKQKISTIVEGKGNDAKFIFKNEENGETVSMDGLGSINNNVENTMPKLDEDYNNWYAQIGEQQTEHGRTSKLDVGAQNNFTTKKDEIKSLILADREKLGDRYYLVSQKLGKTPIFYSEGDDKKELLAKSGVIESNAEFIKMVTNTNGETYAELTDPQKDAMKKNVDDELAIRVKKSEHTRPEGGGLTINQQIGDAKTKETGNFYEDLIAGNINREENFIKGAQQKGNTNMLSGITAPYKDPDTDIVKDTPVYQNDGKIIKILHQDANGNIVQDKTSPNATLYDKIRFLERFYKYESAESGSKAVATTKVVRGKK